MHRDVLEDLKTWLASSHRKPLVLRGARQVGKTWLARTLAKESGRILIECNFEKQPELASLFSSNDPKTILMHLESVYHQKIDPHQNLLFLDEIQAFPELLAKLRWFAEDLPELPVVTAGSLLEFVLAEHSFSMPVGRINYCHVEPLSFEEFLQAQGKEASRRFLNQFTLEHPIPEMIHTTLLEAFKEYVIVGGLPAAVASWTSTRSLIELNQIHQDLLNTYHDDFAKYAKKLPLIRLQEVFAKIPILLGEKFAYRKISQEIPSVTIKQALQLLTKAKLCSPVRCSSANGLPLAAEVREREFKMLLIDVGLASTALHLKLSQLPSIHTLNLVNQGGISEQVIGQLLRTMKPFYVEPELYYWAREDKGGNAEIDYLLTHHHHIIPIEVKSGSTGSLKSLHFFMALKKLSFAIRLNTDFPSLTTVNTKTPLSEPVSYRLLSLPMYLTEQIDRLLEVYYK